MDMAGFVERAKARHDAYMRQWKVGGIGGTLAERETFLDQVYHGARAQARICLLIGKLFGLERDRIREALERAVPEVVEADAEALGMDEQMHRLYVAAYKGGYESVFEEGDQP